MTHNLTHNAHKNNASETDSISNKKACKVSYYYVEIRTNE